MTTAKNIDQKLFDSLTAQAQASPRKRKNFNFHASDAAVCQRLLNALEMDSYIQPHRHLDPTKDETLIVVRGKLGAIFFDEAGNVTHKVVIEAGGDNVGLHTPSGVFHSFVALAPNSVIFEAKAGPYVPVSTDEKASWAPAENALEATAYLKKMFTLFA
ncbi:MAG: WbuC family cupin fold metalloprotein [Burkholderiales bacterium]